MQKKERQSNIELLRILAMMGVLAGHGVGMVNALPTRETIPSSPLSSLFFILFSCVFVGGVNVFVLISGWFGIRASVKGLLKLLFQFFFLLWGVTAFLLLTGMIQIEELTFKNCLGLTDGYWFVVAYIGLYILSPVLNLFAEQASQRQQQLLLISFYAFQCYYSWTTSYLDYFGGYSIVLFIGLYLTARYFKRFPVEYIKNRSWSLFIILAVCASLVMLLSLYFFGNAGRMVRYDNPLVILEGICLIFAFQKWHFQSKIVNWLAASCFAVYVLHYHPYIFGRFLQGARAISTSSSGLIYVGEAALYLMAVYLACAIVDQLRILLWYWMIKRKDNSGK